MRRYKLTIEPKWIAKERRFMKKCKILITIVMVLITIVVLGIIYISTSTGIGI